MASKQVKQPIVLFNASVILSGLYSPSGGSAKLLNLAKTKKIKGVISEIILDEAVKHVDKIKLEEEELVKFCLETFIEVYPPPKEVNVENFKKIVTDDGDAHVLASYEEIKADYLVTLDKKHLLILQGKIKDKNIVSPKELIEMLN